MTSSWLYFPYPSFKPNQERLLSTVYEAVKENRHAIVDGASGLGKTAGALGGALQICKERDLKILYAARTYKELDRVIEELTAISRKAKVSGVSIRGRAEMCVNDAVLRLSRDSRTIKELCSDLTGSRRCKYYCNLDDDSKTVRYLYESFLDSPTPAFDLIQRCRENELCPYEMAKFLLPNVDVVALSYAYIFSRDIRETFMKRLRRPLSQYVLVLDEAHNLPDLANEYEGDRLSSAVISLAVSEAENYGKADIRRFAEALLRILGGAEGSQGQVPIQAQGQGERLLDLRSLAEGALKEARIKDDLPLLLEEGHAFGEKIKSLLLAKGKVPRSYIHRLCEFFQRSVETSGKPQFVHLAVSGRREGSSEPVTQLEIVSLDPRSATAEVLKEVPSSISMSGTLENMEAYGAVVGIPSGAAKVTLPSPFSEDQTMVLVCRGVSTAYESRGPEAYVKMVSKVLEVVRSTPGGTGIFCSSYEVMEGLLSAGLKLSCPKPLFIERQRSRSTDHDRMLGEFKAASSAGGGVLLGVMGGRFSEGEDYPGDEMNSVVVVGVPYQKPSAKVGAQIDYYESIFPGRGKEYGYIIPAMRKASQAAGRPFRNLDDRGVIVFMDYRFSTAYLTRFLPEWIRGRLRLIDDESGALEAALSDFYG